MFKAYSQGLYSTASVAALPAEEQETELPAIADAWFCLGLFDPESLAALAEEYTPPPSTMDGKACIELLFKYADSTDPEAESHKILARALLCYFSDIILGPSHLYEGLIKPAKAATHYMLRHEARLAGYKTDPRALKQLIELRIGDHALTTSRVRHAPVRDLEYCRDFFNLPLTASVEDLFLFRELFIKSIEVCDAAIKNSDQTCSSSVMCRETLKRGILYTVGLRENFQRCNGIIPAFFLIWHGLAPDIRKAYAHKLCGLSYDGRQLTLNDFFAGDKTKLLEELIQLSPMSMLQFFSYITAHLPAQYETLNSTLAEAAAEHLAKQDTAYEQSPINSIRFQAEVIRDLSEIEEYRATYPLPIQWV